jgi:hypothetical protein
MYLSQTCQAVQHFEQQNAAVSCEKGCSFCCTIRPTGFAITYHSNSLVGEGHSGICTGGQPVNPCCTAWHQRQGSVSNAGLSAGCITLMIIIIGTNFLSNLSAIHGPYPLGIGLTSSSPANASQKWQQL